MPTLRVSVMQSLISTRDLSPSLKEHLCQIQPGNVHRRLDGFELRCAMESYRASLTPVDESFVNYLYELLGARDIYSLADAKLAEFTATLKPPPPRLDDESRRRLEIAYGVPSPVLPRSATAAPPQAPLSDSPPAAHAQAKALPLPGTSAEPHASAIAQPLPQSSKRM
jgi:hypothetical protein